MARPRKSRSFIPVVKEDQFYAALKRRTNPAGTIAVYRILQAHADMVIDFLQNGGKVDALYAALAEAFPPGREVSRSRFGYVLTIFKRAYRVGGWKRKTVPADANPLDGLPWWAKTHIPPKPRPVWKKSSNSRPLSSKTPASANSSEDLFARLKNPSLAEINTAKVRSGLGPQNN